MSDDIINDDLIPEDQLSEPLDSAWVKVLQDEYNAAPSVPRAEMWAAIESATGLAAGPTDVEQTDVISLSDRRSALRPWMGWAAAASILLWMGVGIGRMTAPQVTAPGASAASERSSVAVRAIASEHIAETESLLQFVRSDSRRSGTLDQDVGVWGRGLLAKTRLLLDSDADVSPEMRLLLEDLELILVQVTLVAGGELSPDRRREEMNLLNEDLEDQNVMPRLRAVVPAARPAYAGT